jgi:ribonuclease HI
MQSEITIYTDGASSGNPGPGGYGVVLISGRHRLEKSEGFRLTTNNRMELMAVIAGLESLKIPGSKVVIYTDSKYVADSVEKGWVFQWEAKAWIKGHANNVENEICDRLAVEAYAGPSLSEDTGYSPEE